MSVNIKKNGTLTKLAGLYSDINLRLSQLLDTNISSLEDGQILAYNNETSKWENQEAPAGVEVVDNLTTQSATSALSANQGYVLNNALAGKADAADVLPTLIASPANKQILSYDSSSSKWVNSVNGNTVLLGTADPAANLGKEGDLYVKLSSPSYGNSYRIHTKSTGGETASIDVDTITDGSVVATQNISYHWPAQTFPDFRTSYGSGNWTVTITSNNVYGRAQGSTISWPYYQTNDVTLTINPPSVYGIFVKSRGIWIQTSKSPVENFAELKDTNFNNLQNGQLAVYNSTTGKWENQTPDFSDKFVITFTPTGTDPETHKPTLTADKTPAETAAAINDGKFIVGNINTGDETFHLSMVTSFVGPESTDSVYLVLGSSFYTGYEEEGELRTYTLDLQSSQYTQESTWENISITFGDIENVHPIIKFSVDENEGVYSMDQDFQELLDAYYSHQSIFLTCNGQEYAYEKYDSSTHTFYFTSTLADSIKTLVLVGDNSTGEWTSITLTESSGGDPNAIKWSEAKTSVKKNWFPVTLNTKTLNDITYTVNEDKTITVNGTCTANTNTYINEFIELPEGDYIISGVPDGTNANANLWIGLYDGSSYSSAQRLRADTGKYTWAFTVTSSIKYVSVRIDIDKDFVANNLVFRPMIRLASIQDDAYVPFVYDNTELLPYSVNNILGAKNLLAGRFLTTTVNGVTFTEQSDRTVVISSSGDTQNANLTSEQFTLKKGSYYLGKNISSYIGGTRIAILVNNSVYQNIIGYDEWIPFTITSDIICTVRLYLPAHTGAISNIKFEPMIRLATDTDSTYQPYAMTNRQLTEKVDTHLDQTATTSTTTDTVYTFTDARITSSSVIDVYADIFGVAPSNIQVTDGSCTVTFPKQATAQSMTCRIYIK